MIPPLPLGTSDQTGKAPNGAPGGDPPPPQPEGGNGPPKGDDAKGNLRPSPKKANVGGGGPPDEPGDDDDGDGDDDDDDDEEGDLSGRDLLNALKQLLLRGKRRAPRVMPRKQITSKFHHSRTPKATETETGRLRCEMPFVPHRRRQTKLSYGLTKCGRGR